MSNINSSKFQEMIQAAASRLNEQAEYVNSLNVFPVPDGDTGTNMGMTITNGAKEVAEKSANTVGEVAQILSKGLLMGARGNSGVILSQLFRGFGQYAKDYEELDGIHLAAALQNGVEVAYKAVMKPVEGTILTVSRGAAEMAKHKTDETDDATQVMTAALEGAKRALAKTPDLLPVLKEVGVVDSGGQGLVYIYEGFLMALNGEFVPETPTAELGAMDRMVNIEHESVANASTSDIKYGYCTEIMVELGQGPTAREGYNHDNFQAYLAGIGNSLLVVDDDEIVKVHVHTEDPGLVMQEGLKYGRLVKVKVDNMRLQNEGVAEKEAKSSKVFTSTSKKDWGLIAIAAGEGLADIFREMGVNHVVSGGQTMNPSTEDILNAVEVVNAEKVIILPNNKNIFMAAKSAAEVAEIPVEVIETATVPQGFTALLSFDPTRTIEENKDAMTNALADVQSGSVTTAIRDTNVDGIEIHKKDTLGMLNNKIVASTKKMNDAIFSVFDKMIDEDSEIAAIYVGSEGKKSNADRIAKELEKKHPNLEVEIHDGKQPVYPYIFSVE
ncbi:DAK2 domain-containing protein [Lactococcus allomyrinae]|uniref:DAK2 domain-containing protein n=1 Tax=Lactococcus allomyrinae TaxID=2419773 RepID=A0A387BG29_9LACT|nr:DAK2 domain-containing protein [Lactococcus allomyrinae]AYG01558.1 DAK2 domain-containing protein [Lactococcus allomyrinae]